MTHETEHQRLVDKAKRAVASHFAEIAAAMGAIGTDDFDPMISVGKHKILIHLGEGSEDDEHCSQALSESPFTGPAVLIVGLDGGYDFPVKLAGRVINLSVLVERDRDGVVIHFDTAERERRRYEAQQASIARID